MKRLLSRLWHATTAAVQRLPFDRWDVVTIAGAGALIRGAAMVYAPAGWLLAGALLVSTGLTGAARGAKGGP
jgi:hypothetical protein